MEQVRALLAAGLASGPRNDAPDGALAMRQRWRLAELRAEDYAFVLLSQLSNLVAAKVSCCSAQTVLPVLLPLSQSGAQSRKHQSRLPWEPLCEQQRFPMQTFCGFRRAGAGVQAACICMFAAACGSQICGTRGVAMTWLVR